MAAIVLTSSGKEFLRIEDALITPIGFECEICSTLIESVRQDNGRYQTFDCELFLNTPAGVKTVTGQAAVLAVRRTCKNKHSLSLRFQNLDQGAFRAIAEHLKSDKIVSLVSEKAKRRA
ncbi:MAG: hypothetical protein WAO12_10900 [Venatoribacter sp.]